MDVKDIATSTTTATKGQEFALAPAYKSVDKVTLYKVGKKSKFLNHSNKEVVVKGIKVPVATSEQLKEMYDADPSYAKFVTPPAGYQAPWAKKS
jgi:hypothetical protein